MFIRYQLGRLSAVALGFMLVQGTADKTKEITDIKETELRETHSSSDSYFKDACTFRIEDLIISEDLIIFEKDSSAVNFCCIQPTFLLEEEEKIIENDKYEDLIEKLITKGLNMCEIAFDSISFGNLFETVARVFEEFIVEKLTGICEKLNIKIPTDESENPILEAIFFSGNITSDSKIKNVLLLISSTLDNVWNGEVMPIMIEHLCGAERLEEYNCCRSGKSESSEKRVREIIGEVHEKAMENLDPVHVSELNTTEGIFGGSLYLVGRRNKEIFFKSSDALVADINFRALFIYLESSFKVNSINLFKKLVRSGLYTSDMLKGVNMLFSEREISEITAECKNGITSAFKKDDLKKVIVEYTSHHNNANESMRAAFFKLFEVFRDIQKSLSKPKSKKEEKADEQ